MAPIENACITRRTRVLSNGAIEAKNKKQKKQEKYRNNASGYHGDPEVRKNKKGKENGKEKKKMLTR